MKLRIVTITFTVENPSAETDATLNELLDAINIRLMVTKEMLEDAFPKRLTVSYTDL